MTTVSVPLKFGLKAEVLTEDTDRAPYVAPPLPHYEHDAAHCRCEPCTRARTADRMADRLQVGA